MKKRPEQSQWLNVYDQLRKAHSYIRVVDIHEDWPEEAKNAICAVDAVLYLAEGEIVRVHAREQE